MEEFPIELYKRTQLKKITMHTYSNPMSNDNMFDYSHLLNSSEYFEEFNLKSQVDIFFLIQGVKYPQETSKVLNTCPLISKVLKSPQANKLQSAPIVIELPLDVTIDYLRAFYSYSISPSLVAQSDIKSVLVMSEYFENTSLSKRIMHNDIIPSMNHLTAVNYFILSYDKIMVLDDNENKETWIQLYELSKSCIISQLGSMTDETIIRLHRYNDALFFDLLQSHCRSINCITRNKEPLLSSIENIFNSSNIIEVIDKLYKEKFRPRSIEVLMTSTKPKTIEMRTEYREMEMTIDNDEYINANDKGETIKTSIAFNQSNCDYNIAITSKDIEGLFLYSLLYSNQSKCIVNNKQFMISFNQYTNYSINLNDLSEKSNRTTKRSHSCVIHIKADYSFTTLVNYLIDHIDQYTSSFALLNSDSSELVIQLLLRLKSRAVNQNTLLSIILNWLSNETNASIENITALSEHINWRLVKIELIAEFYIKYSFALKKNLINMLMMILKDNRMDKIVRHMTVTTTTALCSNLNKGKVFYRNKTNLKICSSVTIIQIIGKSSFTEDKSGGLLKDNNNSKKNRTRGLSNLTTSSTQFAYTTCSRKSESMYSGNTNLIQYNRTPTKDSIMMSKLVNNLFNQVQKK